MLYLLDTPRWATDRLESALPDMLPGWSVAYLAFQQEWVTRERLCALLWPEASTQEAQHNLRVNLYRMRALLEGWGMEAALETERKRVRLALPTDVLALREALARPEGTGSLFHHRQPLLTGMSFAGFPALLEWVELERTALHAAWRDAALARLDAQGLPPPQALELCRMLLTADPLDDAALRVELGLLADQGRAGDARRRFEQFRARLRDDLNLDPPPDLTAWVDRLSAPGPAAGAAPARDAFIGRATELDQLEAMLVAAPGRIVTLKGPGGVGKSRLARELARRIAARWRDGAVDLALSGVASAAAALPRLAEKIGLTVAPREDLLSQIAAALAAREHLVVLENAEHLDDVAPLVVALQSASPGSAFLVTSREPLAIAGERIYTLDGLARPQPGDAVANADAALGFDALRLFASRARAANAGFDLAAELQDALELVQATGGWPLALELAAAAVAQQGVAPVLAELRQSLDALVSGAPPDPTRHASVRASIAVSWRRLAADEQALLAALGVFRGAFARAGALVVAAAPAEALARLVARSLVQVAGRGRLELHPLIARFAAERLAEDPARRTAVETRYARHFADRLREAALAPQERISALHDEIDAEFEDFRAAWSTLVRAGDRARLAAAAPAWAEFGTRRGRTRELIGFIATATPATAADPPARGALLRAAAVLHYRCGEFDAAVALSQDALATAQATGDAAGERAMRGTLALSLKSLGRYDEAERHARAALAAAREAGDEREVASHANTCAMLAKMRGDHAAAGDLYETAIAIHRRDANPKGLAICLNNLGNVHRALGNDGVAQEKFEECLRIAERHGVASTRAYALINLAHLHEHRGDRALARSYVERARAEPAAEVAVLTAADIVIASVAIADGDFERAREALRALARRARETGLHAALLDALRIHAELLAATGQREDALLRFVFLFDHPQLPAMQRDDTEAAIARLAPTDEERSRARATARGTALEVLVENILAPESHRPG